MLDDIRQEFITRTEELRTKILYRYKTLNFKAVGLFGGSLACWSVDQPIIQIIALCLVLFFFSFKVFEEQCIDQTFPEIMKGIRDDIEASILIGDIKDARIYQLDKINKELLDFKSSSKATYMFLIAMAFWTLSAGTFIYRNIYSC